MDRLARALNWLVLCAARHWLALVNGVIGLVLTLSLLAPWLMLHGYVWAGRVLYWAFQPLCHQLPERSYFLGGPQPWYTYAELTSHLGFGAPLRFIGDAQVGYKVAFCERDVAIFAGWLVAGLLFGLVRRRLRPLPWQGLVLLSLPMAIDGSVQWVGLLESDPLRRTITGLLFAVGVVWFAFPLVERGMGEAREIARRDLEERRAVDR